MSTVAAQPAEHQARVEITQRHALALNGWFGVIVLFVCAGGAVLAVSQHVGWILWLPILVFFLVVIALVVVPPGQTSVIQFFGTLRRHAVQAGLLVGAAAHHPARRQRPGAQLRDRSPQGQRR